MPSSQKTKGDTEPKKSTLCSRVANMATASARNELVATHMATLIQASLAPIQSSIASFREMVDTLGQRVTSVEITTGENFEALSKVEKMISELQAVNATLVDPIDDLDNHSRRANLWHYKHARGY